MTGGWLVVGLGNPGAEYRSTRHNLGFQLVEILADRWRLSRCEERCRSRLWRDGAALLAQPLTYMNRSGWAVECLVDLFELEIERVLLVFDDVSLPLGRLRLRSEGGAGGHRGVESVLASLRSQAVPRLRLGIAPAGDAGTIDDLSEFVLSRFEDAERASVESMLQSAAEAVESCLADGVAATMSRVNA